MPGDPDPPASQQRPFGGAVALVLSTGLCNVTVPNVVGQTQDAAQAALTAAGLTVGNVTEDFSNEVPKGQVISQTPAAGAALSPNSAVSLLVSKGKQKTGIFGCSGGAFEDTLSSGKTSDLLVLMLTVGTITVVARRRKPVLT